MKINSFKASGVHEYLNFDIEFYPELTFLIGINGSGKTTALKLILGLTSPSFNNLNQIDYDYCEVICSTTSQEKNILIRAEQNKTDNTFSLRLKLNSEEFFTEPISRFIRNEESIYNIEDYSLMEQRFRELFDSLEVTKKIRELATPKFLGLDRRIYEGKIIDYRHKQQRRPSYQRTVIRKGFEGYVESQSIDTSLDEVQSLVFDYIRKIAQQQSQISDDFKEKIFTQSFYFVEKVKAGDIPSTQAITQKKQEVLTAVDNLGIKYLDWSINSFFGKMFSIAEKNEKMSVEENKIKREATTASILI